VSPAVTGAVAVVAIGRNEGARLVACLASLAGHDATVVYVDSGSTDGSVAAARAAGAEVVALDMGRPFTAARARNAGFARLREIAPDVAFVQFLDGDCEVAPGWLDTARAALAAEPDVAVVCGRRREKFPEATIWNRMIDREWASTPPGEVLACGGDAMMRVAAFAQVGGFDPGLIAGEEPELCYRLRAKGWRIRRLDAEMTRHDAALTRVGQWWQRARRTGHTYAEGAAMYGSSPERYRVAELRRALLWGAGVPLAAVLGALAVSPWALLLLLAWPAQMLRLWLRGEPWADAVFLTLGKPAEVQGILGYWRGRLTGRRRGLIEYK
jgi:GT2 family glycosyltransferase